MNRALRRHHGRVAKARRIQILLSHGIWDPPACPGTETLEEHGAHRHERAWLVDARDDHSTSANRDSSSRAPRRARMRSRHDSLAQLQEAT
jgi:hypothetical protein